MVLLLGAWLFASMIAHGRGRCDPLPLLPSPVSTGGCARWRRRIRGERPNVEMSNLTALVIRALGLIVGQRVREQGVVGDSKTTGDIRYGSGVRSMKMFIPTSLITDAVQQIRRSE